MSILSHGSDLRLAPTIEPMVRALGGRVRTALERLSAEGFRAVQLDAALAGLRPRELDRRARQDLTALLGRQEVQLAGLDLFIPRRHFLEPAHVDRAMSAVTAAIELAADLGRVPVSLALPIEKLPPDLKQALVAAADGRGLALAVHAEDEQDQLARWIEEVDLPALGAGLDPASLILRGDEPLEVLQRLGRHIRVARLSDAASGQRTVPGRGELDVVQYRVMADVSASGREGPIVLDLRSLPEPLQSAAAAGKAWDDAAFTA